MHRRQAFLKVSLFSHLAMGLISQPSFLTFSPGTEKASVISAKWSISVAAASSSSEIIPKKKVRIYWSKGLPPVSSPGTSVMVTVSTSTLALAGSSVMLRMVGGQPIIAPQAMS